VVGLVFGFTSTAGAALWASDLEREKRDDGMGEVNHVREECVERTKEPTEIDQGWNRP